MSNYTFPLIILSIQACLWTTDLFQSLHLIALYDFAHSFSLLCLRKPNHRYGIVQMVEKMTNGAIRLTPGTMYGSLSKMEKDNVIHFIREEDKWKIYQITDLGLEVLQIELKRIERLYKIAQEEM